mgnify:CR=1 FL=1
MNIFETLSGYFQFPFVRYALIAGVLIALTEWLGGTLHDWVAWIGMPLIGLFSACRTTRRGLLNYAAWLAPPAGMALGHLLVWSYMPDPGPVLLCALISLVGAAAGEVLNRQEEHEK